MRRHSLADSFARAGFLTIAPDLFDGSPAPADLNAPGFNSSEFLAAHGPDVADPKIASAIEYARAQAGEDAAIALPGYCYGGRYAFRFVAEGKGGDVAFAAHPSLLEDNEVEAIQGPASIAAAGMKSLQILSSLLFFWESWVASGSVANQDVENDSITPTERRREIEDLLVEVGQPYQVSVYSGTDHGFGVRANVSDPEQKFGKETAFLQAVQWFDNWA